MKIDKFYIGCAFMGASAVLVLLDYVMSIPSGHRWDIHALSATITAFIFLVIDRVEREVRDKSE